jgi:hypothetical protein
MRARLAPAFAALGAGAPAGSEPARLAAEGAAWCSGARCGLVDAPAVLEHGRDLEARLEVAQGGRRTRTGEVLGMHTVAELADLVAAERYQLAAFLSIQACPPWAAADPVGYGTWAAAVFDAAAKLSAAIELAQSVIDLTPSAVASVTPARALTGPVDLWQGLVDAAHPFVDLSRRFIAAGFCPFPDMRGMPQPKAPDLDLKGYVWADAAAKKVEDVGSGLGGTGKGVLIGALAAVALFAFVKISR